MAVAFWGHCFVTVEMASPRLGSIPAGYIINEPNREAVWTGQVVVEVMAELVAQ